MLTLTKAELLGKVYKALKDGDPISDTELWLVLPIFRDLIEMIDSLGPGFGLFASELRRREEELQGFLRTRSR